MSYEWDEKKRQINLAKHKIDFVDATYIFDDFYIELESSKEDEKRFLVIGIVNKENICVIYTPRGDKKRIISARKCRKKEREMYEKERKN